MNLDNGIFMSWHNHANRYYASGLSEDALYMAKSTSRAHNSEGTLLGGTTFAPTCVVPMCCDDKLPFQDSLLRMALLVRLSFLVFGGVRCQTFLLPEC